MKAILMIIGYSVLLSLSMSHTEAGKENVHKNIPAVPYTIHSTSQVMPMLQKKCSPCHFEGGKMYAKMPFDKVATLITHQAGMLKRLESENEKELLKKFIRENVNDK